MIFSTLSYLLLFLPITVIIYHILLRYKYIKYTLPFLIFSSLFFYAYWNPPYVGIIIFSIVINFFLGKAIQKAKSRKKALFILGISINVSLLCYFKYTNFAIDTINTLFQTEFPLTSIFLPLGISFYTFQQIAYLSDIYTKRHPVITNSFQDYAAFVCFFPQLIAGPIVHHKDIVPQFHDTQNHVIQWENMYHGLYFLSMGLAKKVLVADNLALVVNLGFDDARSLSFLEASFASVAYSLQLYFDFSGYADMAIGCALFFNIKLPINFNSPFKAVSVQDYWRRWNITLSRWLTWYIFVPLGGNRCKESRIMANIFCTLLISGLWHGAGWTFIVWGALHGIALIIHRIWSRILGYTMPIIYAWVLTFVFIILSRIPFRAANFEKVDLFIEAFLGYNGFAIRQNFSDTAQKLWSSTFFTSGGMLEYTQLTICLLLSVIFLKNSQELLPYLKHTIFRIYMIIILSLSLISIALPGYRPEFIYFQF